MSRTPIGYTASPKLERHREDPYYPCTCGHAALLNPTVTVGNILARGRDDALTILLYHPAEEPLKRVAEEVTFRRTSSPVTEVRVYGSTSPPAKNGRPPRLEEAHVTRIEGVIFLDMHEHKVVITLYELYGIAIVQYV